MPGNDDSSPTKPNSRFLRSLVVNGRQIYIIADYHFWVHNEPDLRQWLRTYTEAGEKTQEGMTLGFANEQEELLFMLRWS